QRMDRNQDGFITTNEVRYFLAQSVSRRDGGGVTSGGPVGRVPTSQKPSTAAPPTQPAPNVSTRRASPSSNRSSPQPTPSKPQSRAQAPAPTPALTIDMLATTPLPLTDGANPYWLAREAQNEARAGLGHANVLFL